MAFSLQTLFAQTNYAFFVAGDMRNFINGTPQKRLFDGVCIAMKENGPGAFLLSPGDCDPAGPIRAAIDLYLGTNYLWYPVVGNHDVENSGKMNWFRQWAKNGIPHLVHPGPKDDEAFTYSFDYGNSHFILLDEYFMVKPDKGNLPEPELAWLERDLAANHQPVVWVSGHQPIKSLPDMDSGRVRHNGQSVSAVPARCEKFLNLLKKYHVTAYICGHTHNSSVAKVDGIWQLDSGHCRGAGDNGSPSTFLKVRVNGTDVAVDVFRANPNGLDYQIRRTVILK